MPNASVARKIERVRTVGQRENPDDLTRLRLLEGARQQHADVGGAGVADGGGEIVDQLVLVDTELRREAPGPPGRAGRSR